jgi:hypothetical protein
MPTIHQLPRRLPATLAALALAFTVAACGGDDESDRADTQSAGLGDEATTTSAPDDNGSGDDTASDEAAGQVPQDSDLDVEMRNPDGTTLTLSHIAFEGDNILVDLEFDNGSPPG